MPPWVTAVNFTLIAFTIAVLFLSIYLIDKHNDQKGAGYVFIVGFIFAVVFTELLT